MYEHISAHQHSGANRSELKRSHVCGCYACQNVYSPSEIDQWIDEESDNARAICSRCNADAVIGDASGYPITPEFLQRMHDYWFDQFWEVNAPELLQEANVARLNRDYLAPLKMRVIEGDTLDPYTNYTLEEDGHEIFHTIFPVEVLVKVAQILPNSKVSLTAFEIPVGDESVRHETLSIQILR